MSTSVYDGDSGESRPELLEPVERFLRAGRAALEAAAEQDEYGAEDDFDVDGLLRRVGFLQDGSAAEESDVRPVAEAEGGVGDEDVPEVVSAGPLEVEMACGDARLGLVPGGDGRSPRASGLPVALPAGGREDVAWSGGTGRLAGSIAMLVPAVAAGVGGVLAVASAVLGSDVAVHAAVAAAGVAAGSLLMLALQRRRAVVRAAPGGDPPSGLTSSVPAAPVPSTMVAEIFATERVDAAHRDIDLAESRPCEMVVITDPAMDHVGCFFELIYEELKGQFAFDPAAEDAGADFFNPLPGAGQFSLSKRFHRSDIDGCLPDIYMPGLATVPNLVAEEVEAFLSSPAADSLWLEQLAAESRHALRLRGQWVASVQQPGWLARSRSCSVQNLILTQIRALVEESFHCSARITSGHHLVILFDAAKVRDAVPHFSGRKPCAERLMLWADREQWAVARQSLSGSMSVVTHLSASHGGAEVLEELLQTYSELVVSPDASVLC